MKDGLLRKDCRHFQGNIPCKPHKQSEAHCDKCRFYEPVNFRILIIKLGAIGDVIRTTPLITKLRKVYQDSEIFWLTYTPEILPAGMVKPLKFNTVNIIYLLAAEYDLLINLDKDNEAIALTNIIKAKVKKGFKLKNGKCAPINDDAYHKYLTGLFDDLNRQNRKSYLEEIFEICGFKFGGEKYILDLPKKKLPIPNFKKPLIGLNTGCGKRWPSRLWGIDNWISLVKKIGEAGYTALLLGGPDEDVQNKKIADSSGAYYLGAFPLLDFIQVVDKCDLVITQVTMALHLAIGLNKKVVLLNNIFNRNEFELYGLGKILEPPIDCKGCYKSECETKCMEMISPDEVFEAILGLMSQSRMQARV